MVQEFRNLSAICISVSVICMQMAACMSDRKARSIDRFFFFIIIQSHITMNDAKLQPTTTHQHKHTDETGQLNSSIHPISSWSIVFSFQKNKTKQNKGKKQICIHDCGWSQGLCSETYFNGQLDFCRNWGKNRDKNWKIYGRGERVKKKEKRGRQTNRSWCL